MNRYRPTTLRLASRHCPLAVDHYESNRAQFREVFGTGIAAHSVLEHLSVMAANKGSDLTEEEIHRGAALVVKAMMSKGREFDGVEEPPLTPEQIMEGAKLAVRWALAHPPSIAAKVEFGVGFDKDWKLVGYIHPDSRFRLIFDVLESWVEADDESSAEGIRAADFKSNWSAGEDMLWSVQIKAQTIAAWEVSDIFGTDKPAFIRREILNLRTQESVANTIWMDENGRAQVDSWKAEITAQMDALDAMPSPRPARPGHGCMGCPWVTSCKPAADFLSDALSAVVDGKPTDKVTLAKAYCVAQSQRDVLAKLLQKSSDEGAIHVGDGVMVGSIAKDGNEPKPEASRLAWEAWEKQGGDLNGFLAALTPGVTALGALSKRLYVRKRDEQDEAMAEWTTKKTEKKFGIHRPVREIPTETAAQAEEEAA